MVMLLLVFSGCVKKVYIKTPCPKISEFPVEDVPIFVEYDTYDDNGTSNIYNLKEETLDVLTEKYLEYKGCCRAMNLNAHDVNSNQEK